jgi:ribonuclease BN (tRNA processing enzyme)
MSKLTITVLGSGSAFTLNNFQTSFLLTLPSGYNLLIDCGTDVRMALHELGKSHHDIDGIYISHLHADHVGGMEWAAFLTYFDPSYGKKADLFIHPELRQALWDTLRGGLKTIPKTPVILETFFNVHEVMDNRSFSVTGKKRDPKFELIRTKHVFNNEVRIPSFGIVCKDPNVLFTTDSQFDPDGLRGRFEEAELIFHDCETGPYESGVHAHFNELRRLPPHIKEKMHLVHFQDNVVGDLPTRSEMARTIKLAGYCFGHNRTPEEIIEMFTEEDEGESILDLIKECNDAFNRETEMAKKAKEVGFQGFALPGKTFLV